MDDTTLLDGLDLENLHYAIEASISIERRPQFFLWVQGALQHFLPHEILLCAVVEPGQGGMTVECFANAGVDVAGSVRLSEREFGMVEQTLQAWRNAGGRPYLACPSRDNTEFRWVESVLRSTGLGNVAAHGACDADGEPRSFFCFSRIPGAVTSRHAYFLELLVPHLHLALLRVISFERQRGRGSIAGDRRITDREAEILRWVQEGKTNQQISQILNISPLTVKNHLQKILKKLGVQNRAQAVAKAIRLNLTQ